MKLDLSAPRPNGLAHDGVRSAYALLLDSLEDEHEVAVARGAMAGAREAGAALLVIAGGAVGDPSADQRAKNFVFDLVPSSMRGVLVLTSAVSWAIGAAGMKTWLERFQPLPTCCLGVAIPGCPSLTVDNVSGVASAVNHLIQTHSARRIAFLRGPTGSSEAEDRLRSFREALNAAGLELDSRLVADGDFSKQSGARALATLLDERRVAVGALDAIVAANDYMALGAMEELARRDIHVPEQVAVVGFDDVDSARSARPTLSTVRQPAESVGREGFRQLAARREAGSAEFDRALPTELVIRRSCGCSDPDVRLTSPQTPPLAGRFETSLVQRRQVILAEAVRAAQGSFGAAGAAWENRLLDALIGELRGEQPGGFSRALAQLLRRLERSRVKALVVHDVLTALRRQALISVVGDAQARNVLEEAVHDARVLTGTILAQAEARRGRFAAETLRGFSRRAHAAVFGDESELSQAAKQYLPALGIEACVVAALLSPGDVHSAARVVLCFEPGGRHAPNRKVALSSLVAESLREPHNRTLLMLPIVTAGKPFGIALLTVADIDGALLDELRDLFGTLLGVSALRRGLP